MTSVGQPVGWLQSSSSSARIDAACRDFCASIFRLPGYARKAPEEEEDLINLFTGGREHFPMDKDKWKEEE